MRTVVLLGAMLVLGTLALLTQPWDSAPAAEAESSIHEQLSSLEPTQRNDDEMTEAMQVFLESLSDAQRALTQFPFENGERTNWHYVPRGRKGLPLADMTAEQENAAHSLLQSVLSESGYEKTLGVVELEAILGRDDEQYFLTVFGTPDDNDPWGWRFEGHHLSLNFSSITDSLTATTPLFLGANPAEVPSGRREGWRVLADEEDLARELLATFTDAQFELAIISRRAPRDIVTGTDRTVHLDRFEGLPASQLTEEQQDILWNLVETYVETVRKDLSTDRLRLLRETNRDSLFFAWAGGTARGEGHYYRIHAPAFLIEYDNTQGGANHIHAVWRDLTNDFADDWLREHYEAHPHE